MYTWGYIKENTLSKLNLTEEEANQQGFLSNFPYYANEAMTQICSAIKPKQAMFIIDIRETTKGTFIKMPDDFIAFSDDAVIFVGANENYIEDAGDEYLLYVGYNEVLCKEIGKYYIPYKARWFTFTKDLHNATNIDAPADVLDALPSYIVSQCWKIDDEPKAAIYRNEYEMFLARIDDTSFKAQRTFHIGGGW